MNFNFRRRGHSRADLIQALHDEMSRVRSDMRASVADAVAITEGRLRKELDVRGEMTELVRRVETARREVDLHDEDVLRALHRVADSYELLASRIEEDRAERRALHGAIEHLTAALSIITPPRPLRPARDQVLGGTVDGGSAADIDLTLDEDVDATLER